jgi:hypothetical protein
MQAEDVVVFGSPGIGSYTKANDFAQRIWAARSKTDYLIKIPVFFATLGNDPAARYFGARPVALGAAQNGHSEYLEMGSRGILNFARIMTGRMKEQR